MERFMFAAQQGHSGDISCCSAWQLLAFRSTEFVNVPLLRLRAWRGPDTKQTELSEE